ncbi:hypothetical protein ABF13_15730, partial [Listeria monocytogenes]|nr:hypothetical protein [Listeria monocytogenes]EAC5914426.1 hypothetical protein [Listeria monocytogenes]EAD3249450.1 hypothetical protein [Listeria monocytogenes]EAD3394916.1 hypothetical protein [Listeria monocytogenes]EAD4105458.1 hypothetical protein [Listeria monocytogenes]
WWGDYSPIQQSQIGEKVDINGTKFILQDWKYNPNKKSMRIKMFIDPNATDTYTNLYKVSFVMRDLEKEDYENTQIHSKILYQDDRYLVVEVSDLPENFQKMVVYVDDANEENNEVALQTFSISKSDDNEKMGGFSGDYRKLKKVKNWTSETTFAYKKEGLRFQIMFLENNIAKKDMQIKKLEEKNQIIHEKQQDLEASKTHKTPEEQTNITYEIHSLDDTINDNKSSISSKEANIAALEEQIKAMKNQIQSLIEIGK